MKGFSYSMLRAACALVIGLVLVLFPDQAAQYLVITVGCVFLVPAFVSIVAHYARPAVGRRGFPLLGIGSFLFGLWLVIAPAFFADLLTYVLGFVLLMGGVQELAALSVPVVGCGCRRVRMWYPFSSSWLGCSHCSIPWARAPRHSLSLVSAVWSMPSPNWSTGFVSRAVGQRILPCRDKAVTWWTRRLWSEWGERRLEIRERICLKACLFPLHSVRIFGK